MYSGLLALATLLLVAQLGLLGVATSRLVSNATKATIV